METHLDTTVVGPMQGADDTQVFCPEQLLNRCLGKQDFAERVIERLLQGLGADLQQMEYAVQKGDLTLVARTAHRLKGSFGNIAAMQLHRLLADLESLSRDQCTDHIPQLLRRITDQVPVLRMAIEQWKHGSRVNAD